MSPDLESLLKGTAQRYMRMLTRFRPCKPGGEFLEQNLITLFAHEFLSQFPDGVAYTEIPFMQDKEDGYWRSRLDGYFATEEFGIFLEAKGSLNSENLFKGIDDDLGRIKSTTLFRSFDIMKRDGELPPKFFGVILADSWQKKQADKWVSKVFDEKFENIEEIETRVFIGNSFTNYQHYILFGWTGEIGSTELGKKS